MWHAIGILLFGAMDPGVIAADEFIPGGPPVGGQPEAVGGPAYAPGQYASGPGMPGFQAGLMPGEQPVYPADVAAAAGDPCYGGVGANFMRPCVFDDYWDFTGSRSPTEYACWNGYGPDWCNTWNGRVEWLMWFSQPRNVPLRVVSFNPIGFVSGTLFGDEDVGNDLRHGARITLGRYLGDSPTRFEGRFWGLEDGSDRFVVTSIEEPRLAITRFSGTGALSLDFVAIPGVLSNAAVDALSKNDFFGADAWLRQTWWNDGDFQLDLLAGYQFTRMDDSFRLRVNTTAVATGTNLLTENIFATKNEFHGASLGLVSDWRWKAISLEVLGKIALGNMRERFIINGRQITTPLGGPPVTVAGGGLVGPNNMGEVTRDRFAVVPELNANFLIHLNPAWRITAGYSLLYLSEAALAAEQIDLRGGGGFPRFLGRETTFLVQGMNLGVDYRW